MSVIMEAKVYLYHANEFHVVEIEGNTLDEVLADIRANYRIVLWCWRKDHVTACGEYDRPAMTEQERRV